MHPHSFLISTLQTYRTCWPIMRHLRSYINKLYYIGHEKETELMKAFLNEDLSNIEN